MLRYPYELLYLYREQKHEKCMKPHHNINVPSTTPFMHVSLSSKPALPWQYWFTIMEIWIRGKIIRFLLEFTTSTGNGGCWRTYKAPIVRALSALLVKVWMLIAVQVNSSFYTSNTQYTVERSYLLYQFYSTTMITVYVTRLVKMKLVKSIISGSEVPSVGEAV